ncbi:MAG: hypothetical protein VB046_07880 [Paludibacter sp.]|nr:hypothetical protein [Paludibacter sp.]
MKNHVSIIMMAAAFILMVAGTSNAQTFSVNEKLVGRWELCTPEGKVMTNPNVRQKVYTKNSYVVLEVDKTNNITFVDFIGTITAESGDKIVEQVIYPNAQIKNMLSKSFKFFYKIEGDYLYLKGMDNTFNEIWVRISE